MTARGGAGRCKDCPPGLSRPAPYPGPRCASCHRTVRKARRDAAHGNYLIKTYNMTPDDYWALYDFQGGKCYLDRRATGKTKRLAVDHDHKCCPTTPTCGRCTRGLVCGTCNKTFGHLRDDPEAFERGADYLRDPPMERMRRARAEEDEDQVAGTDRG